MPINSRRKGHDWERRVARDLREIFGKGIRRGYQTDDNAHEPDVAGTPFWIECKCSKRIDINGAMEQAIGDLERCGDLEKGEGPELFFREGPKYACPIVCSHNTTSGHSLVTFRYHDLLRILELIFGTTNQQTEEEEDGHSGN